MVASRSCASEQQLPCALQVGFLGVSCQSSRSLSNRARLTVSTNSSKPTGEPRIFTPAGLHTVGPRSGILPGTSPSLFQVLVFPVCSLVPARERSLFANRPSVCLESHCHFWLVCSRLPPSLLRTVCLVFEAFDFPQWFHVFFLIVAVSSTFQISSCTSFTNQVWLEF